MKKQSQAGGFAIETVPISSLRPAPYNPRKIKKASFAGLKREVEEFGLVENLVANRRKDGTLVVVGGHQRLEVARSLGWSQVPVKVVLLDLAREKALNLALNNPEIQGYWDVTALSKVLGDLDGLSELAGFSDEEVNRIGRLAGMEAESEVAVPDPPKNPRSRPGSIWICGEHRIMCGDSHDAMQVGALIIGAQIDCLLTDPPYGARLTHDWSKVRGSIKSRMQFGTNAGKRYDQTVGDEAEFDPRPMLTNYPAREKFLFGGDYFVRRLPEGGSWLVWDKRRESQERAIGSAFELIWTARAHKRLVLRHEWSGFLATEKRRDERRRIHPNQKPIALMNDILSHWTKRGQTIADPYSGVGTVMLACQELERRCLSMEIDPRYCDVVVMRWEAVTGSRAVLSKGR